MTYASVLTPSEGISILRKLGNNQARLTRANLGLASSKRPLATAARQFAIRSNIRYQLDHLLTTLIKLHSNALAERVLDTQDYEKFCAVETGILKLCLMLESSESSVVDHVRKLADELYQLMPEVKEADSLFTKYDAQQLKSVKYLEKAGLLQERLPASAFRKSVANSTKSRLELFLENKLLSFSIVYQSEIDVQGGVPRKGPPVFKAVRCLSRAISEEDCAVLTGSHRSLTQETASYLAAIKEKSNNFESAESTCNALRDLIAAENAVIRETMLNASLADALKAAESSLESMTVSQKEKLLAMLTVSKR